MARKRLRRTLAALPRSAALRGAEHKSETLAAILRRAAVKHRSATPQVFYALRDVAAQFDVPVSLVAGVYRQLEYEGLLTRLRGSRTLINARGTTRNIRVRRIVAIPMPVSIFLTRRKARLFFIETRRELDRLKFRTVAVFYEDREARPDLLAARLSESNADAVLWYMPNRCARDTSHVLRDRGICVIPICDGGTRAPWCRYEVRRDKALPVILTHWRAASQIGRLHILRLARDSGADEDRIAAVADAEQMEHETVILSDNAAPAHLPIKPDMRPTGYVVTGSAASFLAFRAPESLGILMQRHRCALFDGPITLPFASMPNARADVIMVDWRQFAKRITTDLMNDRAFQPEPPQEVEATVHLAADLSRFVDLVS